MSRVMIEPYPHQLGGRCGSGALRDLLHWSGLGGGLSFMYTRYHGLTPPMFVAGRNSHICAGA